MTEFTETTAENLKFLRGARGMKQEDVAEILGLPRNAVSKIEGKTRSLSDSEKRLLDWYFFGTLPPTITATLDLPGVLEFSSDEWRVVKTLAVRAGQTPEKWIATTIRAHVVAEQTKQAQGDNQKDGTTDR